MIESTYLINHQPTQVVMDDLEVGHWRWRWFNSWVDCGPLEDVAILKALPRDVQEEIVRLALAQPRGWAPTRLRVANMAMGLAMFYEEVSRTGDPHNTAAGVLCEYFFQSAAELEK